MNEPKADLTLRSVKIPLEQCLGVEEKAVQTPSRESDIANAAPQSCGDCAQRCLRDKRCEAFNFYIATRRCNLIEKPNEYSDDRGADVGIKMQVAQ